jgi:hypothetical protein
MTNLSLSAISLFIYTLTFSQSFNSPESVEFDPVGNRYIVSNTNGGQLLALVPGQQPSLFTDEVSAPYGLVHLNGVVYVCDDKRVKGYNLFDATEVFNLSITGASFLNGICADTSGNLYVTDFTAKRIYKVNLAGISFTTVVANTGSTPNGILYDSLYNRLVFGTWGSNAKLIEVSIPGYTLTTLKTTSLSQIDGVVMDRCRNFLISEWGTDKIHKIDSTLTNVSVLFSSGINNPADLYFNPSNDTLAVPNTAANSVLFFYVDTCAVIDNSNIAYNESPKFEIKNIHGALIVLWSKTETNASLGVTDITGKTVFKKQFLPSELNENYFHINTESWSSGYYFISFTTVGSKAVKKVFISN